MGQRQEPKKPGLNPLSVPWGQKPKKEPQVAEEPIPSFIGVRNEAVRDNSSALQKISIKVRGSKGAPDGEYELEWRSGAPLKSYLGQLKLLTVAAHLAVRDLTRPEAGKLRLNHIPEPGAKIVLGDPRLSSAAHLQRSNHNAARLAQKMGGGAAIVEVPIRRK